MNKGLVTKATGSVYFVKINDKTLPCKLKGKMRTHKGLRSTSPVVVGDVVKIEINGALTGGVIYEVEDRKNYIIRKSTKLSKQAHILAANIDTAFLVITLRNPVTNTSFIDRFLITAEAYHIPARLLLNKTDIYSAGEIEKAERLLDLYNKAGYESFMISAENGKNFEKLLPLMKDKISLFAGNSGVGKSSIINRINPDINLKTRTISTFHKSGKHTTTFSEMFELPFGGYIIDTPGIKGFGLIDIPREELGGFFPEILERASQCQYHNCSHTHEPGCKVKEAAASGEIAESRYKSYINMYLDEHEKYRT